MARFFKPEDIDEFRDCFYLNCASGQINHVKELTAIMRSLGMSPTVPELESYLKSKLDGKLSFADFLDVMHIHSKKERVPQEILEAFQGMDRNKTGQISIRDLKHILCDWGESFEPRNVDQMLRDMRLTGPYIKYQDLIRLLTAPIPDY